MFTSRVNHVTNTRVLRPGNYGICGRVPLTCAWHMHISHQVSYFDIVATDFRIDESYPSYILRSASRSSTDRQNFMGPDGRSYAPQSVRLKAEAFEIFTAWKELLSTILSRYCSAREMECYLGS